MTFQQGKTIIDDKGMIVLEEDSSGVDIAERTVSIPRYGCR